MKTGFSKDSQHKIIDSSNSLKILSKIPRLFYSSDFKIKYNIMSLRMEVLA